MIPASPCVYLVDDDHAVLKGLSRLLRSAGYRVRAFGSPEEFLTQHQADEPGCAVIDIAMRGMNGLALLRTMVARRIARPVIFITGHGSIPLSVDAMRAGASDFITKPICEHRLIAAIEAAVEKDRLARSAGIEIGALRARFAGLTRGQREALRYALSGRFGDGELPDGRRAGYGAPKPVSGGTAQPRIHHIDVNA
jgi:FixJ family two-component response regulator